MKLTDALLGEHGAFNALFNTIETLAETSGDLAQIEGALAALAAEVSAHAALEEELLFAALEPLLENGELIAEMRGEHREIRAGLERIEDAQNIQQAVDAVRLTLTVARRHFRKEEEILYPLAERMLGEETLTRLGEAWAAARQVKTK